MGEAFREALGDKAGISRFGDALVPLDEALAQAVVDVSGNALIQVKRSDGKDKYSEDLPRFINYARKTAARYVQLKPLLNLLDKLLEQEPSLAGSIFKVGGDADHPSIASGTAVRPRARCRRLRGGVTGY